CQERSGFTRLVSGSAAESDSSVTPPVACTTAASADQGVVAGVNGRHSLPRGGRIVKRLAAGGILNAPRKSSAPTPGRTASRRVRRTGRDVAVRGREAGFGRTLGQRM